MIKVWVSWVKKAYLWGKPKHTIGEGVRRGRELLPHHHHHHHHDRGGLPATKEVGMAQHCFGKVEVIGAQSKA